MAVRCESTPVWRVRSAAKRASGLAERQFGAICRAASSCESASRRSAVDSWLRSGRLHPRYPGVYAYGRPGLGRGGGAVRRPSSMRAAERPSAASPRSGGWNCSAQRPRNIHVDAPGRARSLARRPHPPPRAHRARPGTATSPSSRCPEALLAATEHLTPQLPPPGPRPRRVPPSSSTSPRCTPRSGRADRVAAPSARALAAHLPQLARCESPLEIDFVLLCERFRLSAARAERRIGRWRPDMLWRDRRLIVELDGKDAHSTPAQLAADERREAELERLGFTVVRFTLGGRSTSTPRRGGRGPVAPAAVE